MWGVRLFRGKNRSRLPSKSLVHSLDTLLASCTRSYPVCVDDEKILTPQTILVDTCDRAELFTIQEPRSLCLGTFRRLFTSNNNCRSSVLQHLHAALPSKQRSIQPFVGGWAEPSQFPSPANCPWIGFGILKWHDWASKNVSVSSRHKMRLCWDESPFPSVYTLTRRVLFHVSRTFLKSS